MDEQYSGILFNSIFFDAFITFLTFGMFFYKFIKEEFSLVSLWWWMGWFSYLLQLIASMIMLQYPEAPKILLYLRILCVGFSGMAIFNATYLTITNEKTNKGYAFFRSALAVFIIIWAYVAAEYIQSFFWQFFPPFFIFGVAQISASASIKFYYKNKEDNKKVDFAIKLIYIGLLLSGIFSFTYPFSNDAGWVAPYGSQLAGLFRFCIPFGLGILLFRLKNWP